MIMNCSQLQLSVRLHINNSTMQQSSCSLHDPHILCCDSTWPTALHSPNPVAEYNTAARS